MENFDVVIAGGGVAGLYAAYRLRKAWEDRELRKKLAERLGLGEQSTLRVVILESDPIQLGGRLRSVQLPFPGGSVIAEVGAMRFTTRQELLRRLLEELEIQTAPFDGDGFTTRYFLRGKHFDGVDIKCMDKQRFPYHVSKEEEGQTPGELVSHVLKYAKRDLSLDDSATFETLLALEKLRGNQDALKPKDWREIRDHGLLTGKVRLQDMGMWNLIHHYLTAEAAHLVEDGFGYESIIGNWNVSDAIPWFLADFAPGQPYQTVIGGFAKLVGRLAEAITSSERLTNGVAASKDPEEPVYECHVRFNAKVEKLAAKNGKIEMSFQQCWQEYQTTILRADERYEGKSKLSEIDWEGKEIRATAVILALPKDPLESLDIIPADGYLKEWKKHLCDVRPHRLVKIVQGYRSPWWRHEDSPKGAGGRIFTDLPLRQVYHFDREWLEERGRYQRDDDRSPGIQGLIVAYLDGHYAAFWRFITVMARRIGSGQKTASAKEVEKRRLLGERLWEFLEKGEDPAPENPWNPARWTPRQRALHLYYYRYGLYERASTKMTHILRELYEGRNDGRSLNVPLPVAGAHAFWESFSAEPEAGWHTWEPGVDSEESMKYMARPFNDRTGLKNVFVCGEAYSNEQGWIEGALKSVEMVMDRFEVMICKKTAGDLDDHVGIERTKPRIVVIGAGVSGLTCGVELQETGEYEVEIIASDLWKNTVSRKPAAIWFPYHCGQSGHEDEWATATFQTLVDIARDPSSGVSMIDFDLIGEAELPHSVLALSSTPIEGGRSVRVPLMEVPVYLPYLQKRFESAGGRVTPSTVERLDDLEDRYDVIVNCSGFGARRLCGDELMYWNRGQVARVRNPGIERATVNLDPMDFMYIIPRAVSEDCILGGIDEDIDDNGIEDEPNAEKRNVFLERCVTREPRLKGLVPIEETVGFRPCRQKPRGKPKEDAVRLEIAHENPRVIHNYGHGGAGFTLSWGCAKEVRRLVHQIRPKRRRVAHA